MRATKFHIRLGDGGHSYLIKATRQETSKSACKWYGTMSSAAANRHADQVLLSNEALDVILVANFLQLEGVC